MKRLSLAFALAALAFSMTILSCDAMFQTNLFSKATHDQLSVSSINGKTPQEIQELIQSDAYREQLASDDSLKTAALDTLAMSYETMVDPPSPLSAAELATGQVAAVAAADILIMTDPDAAAFSASVVGAIDGIKALNNPTATPAETTTAVANIVGDILPYSISSLVSPGASMPTAFEDMLTTFTAVEGVFRVLGYNLTGTDTGVPILDGDGNPTGATVIDYAYESGVVTDSEALSIAVNAAIATVVTSITPASGYTAAEAIWAALCDPTNAVTYISFSPTVLDDSGYLGNLLSAANFSL